MNRAGRACIVLFVLAACPAFAQARPACTETLLAPYTKPFPAPTWTEVLTHNGVPDYRNVSDNVQIATNLRILVSVLEKAIAELKSGQSAAGFAEADGTCLCRCNKSASDWVAFYGDTVSAGAQQALQRTQDRYVADVEAKLRKAQGTFYDAIPSFTADIRKIINETCSSTPNACAPLDPGANAQSLYDQSANAVQAEMDALFGPLNAQTFADIRTTAETLLKNVRDLLQIVQGSDRVAGLLQPSTQKKLRDIFEDTQKLFARIASVTEALAKLSPQAGAKSLQDALTLKIEASFKDAATIAPKIRTAVQATLEKRMQAVHTAAKELYATVTDGRALLDQFTNEVTDGLLRDLTQVQGCYGITKRKDCTLTQFCKGTEAGKLFGSDDLTLPLWLPTEVFRDGKSALRWALQTVDWLEKAKQALTKGNPQSSAKMQELLDLLKDGDRLAKELGDYVDKFTEGYHLGAYSDVRPDLHMCVGYAGHGVMAEIFNTAGGDFRGGASYLSANLSDRHRAALRAAGFTVFINGRNFPLAPGVSLNMQIDGFRLWNRDELFGIKGLRADTKRLYDEIATEDVFSLVKCCGPGVEGNCITCPLTTASFFYKPYYNVNYGSNRTWPRAGVLWENDEPIAAVFGAGLNLDLEMKTRRWSVPPIPIFPGAKIKPWLSLDAGVRWDYRVNELRDTLLNRINENIKTGLTEASFGRDFHPLQAPDVSEDVDNGARIQPKLGADLVVGLDLASWLTIGITANLYVGVDVNAGGFGGVIDFNRALVEALKVSNPPPGNCKGKIEQNITRTCSNEMFKPDPCVNVPEKDRGDGCPPASAGTLYSTGTYVCNAGDLSCSGAKGYCTDADGAIVLHDVTREQCEAQSQAAPRCVATYRNHPSEPGGPVATWKDVVATVLPSGIHPPELRDSEMARAQWEADQLTSRDQCESMGWCFNWGYKPGVNGPDYSAIYYGVAPSRATCPPAQYEDGKTIYDARCSYTTDPLAPLPAQFIRFTWVDPGETENPSTDPPNTGRTFHPYQCVQTSRPEITDYEGPDCNPIEFGYPSACPPGVDCLCDPGTCPPGRICVRGVCLMPCDPSKPCGDNLACVQNACVMANKVPFAEQIVAELQRAAQPQHVVATYGLNKLITSVVLGFGVRVGMDYRIFRKWRKKSLLDYTDAIPLVEHPFVKHQLGLEAQYQDDCNPAIGQATNHQTPLVKRYGSDTPVTSTAALLGWCKGAMAADAQNPAPLPPVEAVVDGAVTQAFTFGTEIAVDFWARGQLCAGGKTWDQYFSGLQTNPSDMWAKLKCAYDKRPLDCSNAGALQSSLVTALGCLDAADPALPWNAKLLKVLGAQAPAFLLPSPAVNTFDLKKLLVDPQQDLVKSNLAPAILVLQKDGWNVEQWLAAVNGCMNDKSDGGRYDDARLEILLKLDDLKPCGGVCCQDGACRQVSSQAQCGGNFRPGTTCAEEFCENVAAPPPGGACMVFGKCQEVSSAEQCQGSYFHSGLKCRDVPAMCSEDSHCPAGTWCRPTQSGARECVPFQPADEWCGGFVPPWRQRRCAPGLVCTDFLEPTGDLGGYCRRACTSVPFALAAWWPLDEAAGPATAEFLARHDGRHVNQPAPIAGVVGRALSFDGVDDYVEVPDAPDLNFGTGDFSFVGWIRTTANGSQVVLDKRQDIGNLGYHIYLVNGRPGIQLSDGDNRNYSATRRIADGEWHLFAVTVDRDRSDGIRFYVDGAPAGVADPTASGNSITSNAPLRFARRTVSPFSYWEGAIDEPALFSRALLADEVKRIYEAGAAGLCKCIGDRRGLEALWPLDETDPLLPVTSAMDVVHLASASLINGPQSVAGMVGGAFSFDGVDDYAEAADDAHLDMGTDDFSIVAWIRTASRSGTQSILDKRSDSTGYHLYLWNGHPGLQLADGTLTNYTAAQQIADDQWHHVAVTVDRDRADGIRWYIDGQRVGAAADPTAHRGSVSNSSVFRLATRTITNDGWWKGALDELSIYRRALTAPEIASLARAGKLGQCTGSRPLVAR